MPHVNDQKSEIAGRLRWAREQAGLSQGQVARAMQVHRPTISQIEAGERNVRIEEIAQFAEMYEVSRDWILSGDSVLAGEADPRIELAARELQKLKKDDLESILRLIQVLRSNEDRK